MLPHPRAQRALGGSHRIAGGGVVDCTAPGKEMGRARGSAHLQTQTHSSSSVRYAHLRCTIHYRARPTYAHAPPTPSPFDVGLFLFCDA